MRRFPRAARLVSAEQICHTQNVLRARGLAQLGVLSVVFGLGALIGRSAPQASESSLLPVTGIAPLSSHSSPVAAPSRLEGEAAERHSTGSEAQAPERDRREGSARAEPPRESERAEVSEPPAPKSWAQIAKHAQLGTVGILAGDRYGAGIIVDRSGLVLTNLHVVQGIDRLSVLLMGDESLGAKVVAEAADLDLALLKLERPMSHVAELGSARELQVGDEVLAVGSPRKMYFSVSRGMVSYLNRKLENVSYIQTDLPINAGNSGGPLVDAAGKVIGVVSFILRDSQGIAFALPIDYALERFAEALGKKPPIVTAAQSPSAAQN